MKVTNMISNRSGREVANQFEIRDGNAVYFQSYNTIIVRIRNGKVTLDREKWDCSRTTGKYRNQFLGETIEETRRKIANGTYKLDDLNE